MGEYADLAIERYLSGRAGIPIRALNFPSTTKAAIADREFQIVEVLPLSERPARVLTNRDVGTKLIVCDRDETGYWVWASNGVGGIHKGTCKVVESGLTINQALEKMGRNPYNPGKPKAIEEPHPDWKKPLFERSFSIAVVREPKVPGGPRYTNMFPGTRLIVCEKDKEEFWIYALGNITSIDKRACAVQKADLTLEAAHERLGRALPDHLKPQVKKPRP